MELCYFTALLLCIFILGVVSAAPKEVEIEKDGLQRHLNKLNAEVSRERNKQSKYNLFPGEEPPSAEEMRKLQRSEKQAKAKVQSALNTHGRLSQEYARALHQYGGSLHRQQRFDELLGVAQEIVRVHEEIDGPEHFNTARALDNLGSVAFRVKDSAACEHAMKRALYVFIQKYGENSKEVLLHRGRMLTFHVPDGETSQGISYSEYLEEL